MSDQTESTETEEFGTAVKDEMVKDTLEYAGSKTISEEDVAKIDQANDLVKQAYVLLQEVQEGPMPVGRVQWIHITKVRANDYNPNAVAQQEMKLLHTSISEDGYTQPVVAIQDETADDDRFIIVDGYHRYTTMRKFADIYNSTGGYLPVVVIDKPIADRIASTVRHNRARGKHSVQGMGNLVFQMLQAGEADATICNKLGLEPEELARLKHITGYSKLYSDKEYSKVVSTKGQLEHRRKWAEKHPEDRDKIKETL